MTEAELLQITVEASAAVLSLFSVFFGIVSAYVAGLYMFLNKAPLFLKLFAFLLLSLAFIFLGAMAWNLQYLGEGMHTAWKHIPTRMTGMESLGPPLIVRSLFIDARALSNCLGWVVGGVVYLLLGYMTFFYRWSVEQTRTEGHGNPGKP